MDITTQKGKTLSMRASKCKKKISYHAISPLALAVVVQFAHADGLDVSASLEAQSILQNRHSEVRNEELLTLSLTPEGRVGYQTRTFKGFAVGSITQMERDSDDVVRKDTYAEYRYGATWEAIDNLLTFQARGNQRFLDGTGNNFLLSDYFLYAEELVRVETQNYSAMLTLPQGDAIAGRATVNYSTGDASESEFQNTAGFNNKNTSGNFTLMNGNDALDYFWNLSGMYSQLERDEQLASGDYSGTYASGSIDKMVYGPFAFRATASYDSNELTDRNDEFNSKREFKSYGAGITYRLDAGHYVSVTANKINSDVERDDGDVFLGVDALWAITPRTSFQASYGRRFYGRSASAAVFYGSKKVRGALTYREEVTSFSQVLGVFVCPVGEVSAEACYQPPSLNYTPDAGEEFIQIVNAGIESTNGIFLRKSAVSEIGLQGKRSTLMFNLQYADDSYLDFDRQRTVYSASVNGTYELGRTTTLTGDLRYGKTEQENTDTATDSTQWLTSVGIRKELGQHLSAGMEASYLTRSGTMATSAYGSEYDERRITLTVRYEYE